MIDSFKWIVKSGISKNKEKYKDAWMFCERGTEARDNAYVMFKYVREQYPNINAYYIIDKNNKIDYSKIEKLGNIIQYNSNEHKLAFISSKKLITTHIGFICPWNFKLYKLIYSKINKKEYIFLQHGITKDNLSDSLGKNSGIDVFVCGAKPEYDFIKENFGYQENQVIYTGLARFDNLHNIKTKNQILVMPTWRSNIMQPSYSIQNITNDETFLNSTYFKKYNSFINNKKIITLLEKYNYELIFYPHYEAQKYIKYFNVDSDSVIMARKEEYSIQSLLKDSKLIITDFSSVFFDFAYMEKPIIYYQFDENNYKEGYFDYERDGFGPLVDDELKLIEHVSCYVENNFEIEQKYKQRIEKFFTLKDNKNSERIFKSIYNKVK
jgi:CDP-glycerol glycerophosphotransferase (TagB/SpsB family)